MGGYEDWETRGSCSLWVPSIHYVAEASFEILIFSALKCWDSRSEPPCSVIRSAGVEPRAFRAS